MTTRSLIRLAALAGQALMIFACSDATSPRVRVDHDALVDGALAARVVSYGYAETHAASP